MSFDRKYLVWALGYAAIAATQFVVRQVAAIAVSAVLVLVGSLLMPYMVVTMHPVTGR